jgi:hypothetical protein
VNRSLPKEHHHPLALCVSPKFGIAHPEDLGQHKICLVRHFNQPSEELVLFVALD